MSLRAPPRGSNRKLLGLPRRVPTRRFIPDGDVEFADKARAFARQIKADPQRFALSADDAQRIDQAVCEFRDALAKTYNRVTRSMETTALKKQARIKAQRVVRKYGTFIRLNEEINASDKVSVGVRERSKPVRRERHALPAPSLRFVGPSDSNSMSGHQHILQFFDRSDSVTRTRPQGATRLELFVELVEPEAKIPVHPGELSGGRMWYVRAFTRSPIHLDFPVTDRPMRVVYWARWTDARGNPGPFCAAVAARVEGWDGGGRALPDFSAGRERQQRIVITSAMKQLPDGRGIDETGDDAVEEVAA